MNTLRLIARVLLMAMALGSSADAAAPDDNHPHERGATRLTQPGQAAFGALSEAVAMLDRDPSTDWSKVDITRLRNHLVDMDEVVMRSDAVQQSTGDAVRVTYTGSGSTLSAIQRMIPAHSAMMNGFRNWRTSTETRPDGVTWIIVSDPSELQRIRALGPYGLLTLGDHHAIHHLAMAQGVLVKDR